jgi:hypothetical protein
MLEDIFFFGRYRETKQTDMSFHNNALTGGLTKYVERDALPSYAEVTKTGTATLTVSELCGDKFIEHDGNATLTTPTAAAIADYLGQQVGGGFEFYIKNTDGTNATTLAGGTGVTVVGTATVAALNVKSFLLVLTAAGSSPAVSIYSLHQGAF